MIRTVQATGAVLPVSSEIHTLTVNTRVPSKYLLVDIETGQVYRGTGVPGKSWVKKPVKASLLGLFIKHILREV